MKKLLLLILFPILGFSQNKNEAEIKVNEGIAFHDEGKNTMKPLISMKKPLNLMKII